MIPYVFGTKCVRLKDENERVGWKGAGNRVADGIFVGIDHTSYMLYNPTTNRITLEPYIWPLDEFELATDGTAAGALRHDVAIQCELSTAAPLALLPSAIKAPKEAPPPVTQADAPVGTRLTVFWRGKGTTDQWYAGTVSKIHKVASGELRHDIIYDVDGGMYPRHDLVNVWKWKRLDGSATVVQPAQAPKVTPVTQQPASEELNASPTQQPAPPAPPPPSTDADGWITPNKRRTTRVTKQAAQAQEPLRRSTRVPGLAAQEISVAEVVMSALERTEATPMAAQAIIDNVMGDTAPESQKATPSSTNSPASRTSPSTGRSTTGCSSTTATRRTSFKSSTRPSRAQRRCTTSPGASLRCWHRPTATSGSRPVACRGRRSARKGATA